MKRKLKSSELIHIKSGYFVYAPLVSLKSFIGNDNLYYTRAEFEIKKDKNREVAKFKERFQM